ncbi:MAG: ABC transporter substrate-binding protein, partial [Mariprofundales bacterium]
MWQWALLLLLLGLITACKQSSDTEMPTEEKTHKTDTISIGIAWSESRGLFVAGANQAVKEANESGGVLGKQLELIVNEDEESVFQALETKSILTFGESGKELSRDVARGFAHDRHNIIAVVGHRYSAMAFAAAYIYQQNARVFIAPTATNLILTSMDFDMIYRMLPTNVILGEQLAEYAVHKKYKRIAVFNERSDSALEISDAFSQAASEKYSIKTVVQQSFFDNMPDRLITKFAMNVRRQHEKQAIDAIFIFTGIKLSIKIIKEFRARGINIPFIGNESLDNSQFLDVMQQWQTTNKQTINLAIPTVFNPKNKAQIGFVRRFNHENTSDPDRFAAMAYDSINTIIHAIHKANSVDPVKIADEIRYSDACRGLTGRISYFDNGDVRNKRYVMKVLMQDGVQYRTLDDQYANQIQSTLPLCVDYDRDRDGIINIHDQSPDDPQNTLIFGVNQDGDDIGIPVDTDNDQVRDYHDDCRTDSTDAISKGVDAKGCPIDSDEDTYPDYRDQCSKDSKLAQSLGVNEHGCPIDSDHDGVADYHDDSPHDLALEIVAGVNRHGVPKDQDADSYPDYRDKCPLNSKADVLSGIDPYGCPLDQDGDGVPNYWDKCVNTTAELKFGIDPYGCAIDTDKDSIADYIDACRTNTTAELKFGIDLYGCAIDTDKDSIADYIDACRTNTAAELKFGIDL